MDMRSMPIAANATAEQASKRGASDDRLLLQQVWAFVEECKKSLRERILLKQWRGNEAWQVGQLIGEKLFAILVDYPRVIERTTLVSERRFYEREYLKETKFVYEYQLPAYTTQLSRRIVPREPQHSNMRNTVLGSAQTAPSQLQDRASSGLRPTTPQHNAVSPGDLTGQCDNPAGAQQEKENPWEGFVKPKAFAPDGEAKTVDLRDLPSQAKLNGGHPKNGKSRRRRKFGLKWFFSSSFRDSKEDKPATLQQTASEERPQSVAMDSLTTQDLWDEAEMSALNTTQELTPFVDSRPKESQDKTASVSTSKAEEDIHRPAEAQEEVFREYFTKVEETIITKEQVTREVHHRYVLREFAIRVIYAREHPLGHSVEVLSRNRYILGEDS